MSIPLRDDVNNPRRHYRAASPSLLIPVVMIALAFAYLNNDLSRVRIGPGVNGLLTGATAISSVGRAGVPRTRRITSDVQRFMSPDGGTAAIAYSDTWANRLSALTRIEFRSWTGELVAASDWATARASTSVQMRDVGWTPDSRFFVYSVWFAQTGYTSLFCYDRSHNRINTIVEALANGGSGRDFAMAARDSVIITVEHDGVREQQTVSLLAPKR